MQELGAPSYTAVIHAIMAHIHRYKIRQPIQTIYHVEMEVNVLAKHV